MNEEMNGKEQEAVDHAAGTGSHFTPPEAIDVVLGNPPLGGDARAERHMSAIDAALILGVLAAGRNRTVAEVTALQMGSRRLCKRWFEKQRNWARRRELGHAEAAGQDSQDNIGKEVQG